MEEGARQAMAGIIEPGHPYVWTIWTRDGKAIRRGGTYLDRVILSPINIPGEFIRQITMHPISPGWAPAILILRENEEVLYRLTRQAGVGPDAQPGIRTVCMFLGKRKRDGSICGAFYHGGGGAVVLWEGSLEELRDETRWRDMIAAQNGLNRLPQDSGPHL